MDAGGNDVSCLSDVDWDLDNLDLVGVVSEVAVEVKGVAEGVSCPFDSCLGTKSIMDCLFFLLRILDSRERCILLMSIIVGVTVVDAGSRVYMVF